MCWGKDNVWDGFPQKARGDRKKKMGGFPKETWPIVGLKKGIKLCLKAGTTCLSFEQTLFKIKSRNLYLIKTFVSKLLKEEKEVRLFFSFFSPLVNICIKTIPKCVTVKIKWCGYVSVGTKRSIWTAEDW